MRLTLSVIKADVGSVGGHTKPSSRMMAAVEGEVAKAICKGLLIDGFVCHTGDDIAIIMTHTRGEGSSEIHQLAWKAFLAATSVARTSGLYGAGQDLLADAPSGNIRGAGPGVACSASTTASRGRDPRNHSWCSPPTNAAPAPITCRSTSPSLIPCIAPG
ncbi:fructose 1,6-bisphosphatase [Bradyrhizobium barranii]|uniref:fructose 1,6-bisphosphatase n=1 Tax=Bradyrhizobium barranii TaxID=2992140 RepID=UPI002AB04B94|nr:fructose 1,6-bisphosphatase [Bradyrhizobium barranii]